MDIIKQLLDKARTEKQYIIDNRVDVEKANAKAFGIALFMGIIIFGILFTLSFVVPTYKGLTIPYGICFLLQWL